MGSPVNNILTKLLKGYLERHRKITEHFARLPWTGKKFEIYLSSGLVTSAFTCSQKMLLADVLASIAIRAQTWTKYTVHVFSLAQQQNLLALGNQTWVFSCPAFMKEICEDFLNSMSHGQLPAILPVSSSHCSNNFNFLCIALFGLIWII